MRSNTESKLIHIAIPLVYNLIASHLRKPSLRNVSLQLTKPINNGRCVSEEGGNLGRARVRRTKRASGKKFPLLSFLYSFFAFGSPSGWRKHKASVKPRKGLGTASLNRLREGSANNPRISLINLEVSTKAEPEA